MLNFSRNSWDNTLDGAQEVPVVTTDGKGTGAFRLDDEGLHYTITVSELSGDITNAHFHRAAAGISGGVVHGINSTFSGNTAQGVWLTEDTLTGELIGALLAGELYINIHTAENGGGEIRGQVLVAGGVGLWADLTVGQAVSGLSGSGSGSAARGRTRHQQHLHGEHGNRALAGRGYDRRPPR